MSTLPGEPILRALYDRWLTLKAWPRPFPKRVRLLIRPYANEEFGRFEFNPHQGIVRVTGDLAEDASTLLHEMAHVVTARWRSRSGHSAEWERVYLAAVSEATGVLWTGAIPWVGDEPDEIAVASFREWQKPRPVSSIWMRRAS